MKKGKAEGRNTAQEMVRSKIKPYQLRLYIAGNESNSKKAVSILEEISQKYLGSNCELKIIDVFRDYQAALKDGVLVAPTLVWVRKGTPAFLIGNFDRQKLLDFLGLTETAGGEK